MEEREMVNIPLVTIDVNHYTKDWGKFFSKKQTKKLVKIFYMASIGQLILCNNIEDAKEIIKNLFAVSLSVTDGKVVGSNNLTTCEKSRQELTSLITGHEEEYNMLIDAYDKETEDQTDNEMEEETDNENESLSSDNSSENTDSAPIHKKRRKKSKISMKKKN